MQSGPNRNTWSELLLPVALIFGLVLLLSLNVGELSGENGEAVITPLESWLKVIVGYLAVGTEIAAAIVVGSAVVRGITTYLRLVFLQTRSRPDETESIRLQLGRVLTLGLEFTVASDILRTAVAPNRRDILTLGAIIFLRTLLNYFLEQEIQQGEQRRAANSGVESPLDRSE